MMKMFKHKRFFNKSCTTKNNERDSLEIELSQRWKSIDCLYRYMEDGTLTEEQVFQSEIFKVFSEILKRDSSFYRDVPMYLKNRKLFNRHCLLINKNTLSYIIKIKCSNYANISELIGKTIISIEGAEKDNDMIIFFCKDGSLYKMYHNQLCCEEVYIEDVCGNIEDLIGIPIKYAEDLSNKCDKEPVDKKDDSYTWTWYKFATEKGWVSIRWYGKSNGCYGEDADLVQLI